MTKGPNRHSATRAAVRLRRIHLHPKFRSRSARAADLWSIGGRKMIENQEVMEAFYAGRRSAAYPLAVNDVVLVKEGRRSGSLAAVISPQAVAPIVSYLVEYGDGSDDIVPLAALELKEPMQPPQRNPDESG